MPDVEPTRPHAHAAEALGATFVDEAGACLQIDRVWSLDRSHGRRRVESCQLDADAPIGLFDARAAASDDWWRRVVFFDIETTGLSGGAGTLAFLAGCAWFDEAGLRVRQFFLNGPVGERALLGALTRIFDETTLLVREELVAGVLERHRTARIERDLVWVRFEAPMGWDVVGFLARVTGELARANVPLGAVCGHSRDHLFLAARHLPAARAALARLFPERGAART